MTLDDNKLTDTINKQADKIHKKSQVITEITFKLCVLAGAASEHIRSALGIVLQEWYLNELDNKRKPEALIDYLRTHLNLSNHEAHVVLEKLQLHYNLPPF
jgi:hypothetical protein